MTPLQIENNLHFVIANEIEFRRLESRVEVEVFSIWFDAVFANAKLREGSAENNFFLGRLDPGTVFGAIAGDLPKGLKLTIDPTGCVLRSVSDTHSGKVVRLAAYEYEKLAHAFMKQVVVIVRTMKGSCSLGGCSFLSYSRSILYGRRSTIPCDSTETGLVRLECP
jgi:hypothetical protein